MLTLSEVTIALTTLAIDEIADWEDEQWAGATAWLADHGTRLPWATLDAANVASLAGVTSAAAHHYARYWVYGATAAPYEPHHEPELWPWSTSGQVADVTVQWIYVMVGELPQPAEASLVPVYLSLLGIALAKHGLTNIVDFAIRQLAQLDLDVILSALLRSLPYDRPIRDCPGRIPAEHANAAVAYVDLAEANGRAVPRAIIVTLAIALQEQSEFTDECFETFQPLLDRVGMQSPDVMLTLLSAFGNSTDRDFDQDREDVAWLAEKLVAARDTRAISILANIVTRGGDKHSAAICNRALVSFGTPEAERYRRDAVHARGRAFWLEPETIDEWLGAST